MELVIGIVVVGTSIWVAVDASNLGARRGVLGGGFFDMGAAGWFFSCLLFWIVGFPAYLLTRSRYVDCGRTAAAGLVMQGPGIGYAPSASGQPSFDASMRSERPRMTSAPQGFPPEEVWARHAAPRSLVDDLSRLAALLDSGAVTKDEFDMLKARILGRPEQ
jgi:hypothetical protein